MGASETSFTIGPGSIDAGSVYLIAEGGVNHNGDIARARKLIDAAADSGADAVKFQTFTADRLVAQSAPTAAYQDDTTDVESQSDLLERYELTREDHLELQEYCREQGITFLSTPFDPESADLLDSLSVPAIKLGSGELTNHPLLRHVAELGRPMIVSTGMGRIDEIRAALDVVREADPDADVALLHCTTAYPADVDEVNLRAMEQMADAFDVPVGYSDHTTLVGMPAFATAAGALIVEKHLTLDRSLPGPDHHASLEPDEFDRAVTLARQAALARGNPEKRPTESERENVFPIRKSLHAARSIDAGRVLTREDLAVKRPEAGIQPSEVDDVLGRRTTTALDRDDPITEADLE
ncbi:N-acetylneuraminate synthase [Halorientalis pallida]|uniref:N-acetylneuraminate synthase n=1 Tax=Halorientalis pallida TaxID=2479928 RepID=A0A498KSU7_9EURY|nr:N-acetylneuraminate synthase [Halorientalis pallida]RXK46929.1 N-acetylneuraminate synthase [Halorientalis pallida]